MHIEKVSDIMLTILLLSMLALVFHVEQVVSVFGTERVEAPNWLDGWNCRRQHNMIGTALAGTDYAIFLNVYANSGTTDGNSIYLNDHAVVFPNDMAFTDNDGVTPLSYWIQSYNTSWAGIWVRICDDLSSGTVPFYVYYGKSGATAASNGSETFLFFDDFEGDSIDTSKWQVFGTVLTSTEYFYSGTKCMKHEAGVDNFIILTGVPSQSSNIRVVAFVRDLMSANREVTVLGLYLAADNHSIGGGRNVGLDENISPSHYIYRTDRTYYVSSGGRTASWHMMEIEVTTNSFFWIDGVQQTRSEPAFPLFHSSIGSTWASCKEAGYWDTFFIRKCVRPEPSHGSWGNEEARSVDWWPVLAVIVVLVAVPAVVGLLLWKRIFAGTKSTAPSQGQGATTIESKAID